MENDRKESTFSLSDQLRDTDSDRRDFTITASARRTSEDWVILHVLASYEIRGGTTQESWGYAWTTRGDGVTPAAVSSLRVRIDVEGGGGNESEGMNTDRVSTGTRAASNGAPRRVMAYAVCEDPHIEASDSSDD